MRNFEIALAAAVCLAAASSAAGQGRTVVSGTVTDLNALVYNGASLTATLTTPVGTAGAYLNGAQIAGTVGPVLLDSTGSFLLNLADNTLVKCATSAGTIVACVPQTQWVFSVTYSPGVPLPVGTGPQTCTATLTISGSSQSVSSSLNACPALTHPGASGVGPGTPTNLPFFATATTLGSSSFQYLPNDTSGLTCNANHACEVLSTTNAAHDSGITVFSADGFAQSVINAESDSTLNTFNLHNSFFAFMTNVLSPTIQGFSATEFEGGTTLGGNCFMTGAASPPCGIGYMGIVGDSNNTASGGQDTVAFDVLPVFRHVSLNNFAAFAVLTPEACIQFITFPCGSTTITNHPVNFWAQEIQDLKGAGSTSTIGMHVEAQTNPAAGNFAIKVEPNGGPVAFDKTVTALLANGATANVTLTVASGTVAMPTAAIAGGACSSSATGTVVTGSAANLLTTDVVSFSFSGGLPGINPGELTIPATIAANATAPTFEYCNETGAPITPPATTLNWRVGR